MDPGAQPFVPRSRQSCFYFARGACRYGGICIYSHVDAPVEQLEPGITAEEEEELVGELEKLEVSKYQKQERDDSTTCVRIIYGSVVTFGAGAVVTGIKLPTTFEYGKWVQNDVVVCTWFRPARMAYLSFADPGTMDEAAELLLKTATPSGRILSCRVRQPQRNDPLNRFALEVRNLDLDCREEWFKDILAANYPLKVKLKEPISDTPPDEARGLVEGLLQSIGTVKNCMLSNDPKRITIGLTACFHDETHAAKAIKELNGTNHEEIGPLRVRRVIRVKFNVPTKIVTALLLDLQNLQKHSQLEHRVRLNLPPTNSTSKPSQSLRIAASGADAPKSIAKVKVELEKLLGGTVIKTVDAPLWHTFFGTSPGLKYLTSLSHVHHLYIHVDVRKSQLLFYGGAVSRREDARRVLLAKVADLDEERQTWVLTSEEFNAALTSGGFARLQEVYNDKVTINIASNPKEIILRGSRKDLQIAKSVFHGEEFWYEGDDASPPSSQTATPDDCCVCMTEPESDDVMRTPCNHIYCRGCFLHQVKSVSEDEIPLRCHARGEEGRCPQIFSLQELRILLDFTTFEALLEASFKIYIRSHPTEYQYCPTPDCQSIYGVLPTAGPAVSAIEPTDTEASSFCIACLSATCTKCKAVFHEGMTCPEYQDSLNLEVNHEFMRDNGIKECPHCQIPIEKNGGCNHVQCLGCNVHVCWNCLVTFQEPGPCYQHLADVHGGNGLNPDDLFGELTDDED